MCVPLTLTYGHEGVRGDGSKGGGWWLKGGLAATTKTWILSFLFCLSSSTHIYGLFCSHTHSKSLRSGRKRERKQQRKRRNMSRMMINASRLFWRVHEWNNCLEWLTARQIARNCPYGGQIGVFWVSVTLRDRDLRARKADSNKHCATTKVWWDRPSWCSSSSAIIMIFICTFHPFRFCRLPAFRFSLHSVGQVIYGTFPIATHWGNRFLLD